MADRRSRFVTVLERELRTLGRTRSVWLLAVGFFAIIAGMTLLSGTSGYVPLSLTLLTPIELLVPVLAAALGYRALLGNRERGELTVLRTFPIARDTFTWGVYCGRAAVLITIVVGSLLVVGIFVPLLSPTPAGLTRTAGLDSPLYYARFIVLSAIYTVVVTAIVVLLSALAHAVHKALVGVVVTILFLAIGFDLAIVIGLANGVVAPDSLSWYLALSPASAYRGLVMTYVVSPVASLTVDAAAPLPSILGLLFWFLAALLTAAWVIWRPTTYTIS